jgi:2-isopropylmalate synthase
MSASPTTAPLASTPGGLVITRDPSVLAHVDVYDTTLRDGLQQEGVSLSVDDKLRVAKELDYLGVQYIEGGWPGANPKDSEFFQRAKTELKLENSTLVSFGMTRRPFGEAADDKVLAELLSTGTPVVCIVGKAWDYHVLNALQVDLDEGVAMVRDSVAYLVAQGRRVFLDAEHFFDGFKRNPEFSMRVLHAAEEAGVEVLVLCDTNGGCLPHEVEAIVKEVRAQTTAKLGIHCHDDTGSAAANSLAAVRAGVAQVQGCLNGNGERTGNAALSTVIGNVTYKLGSSMLAAEKLPLLTSTCHHIAELMNQAIPSQRAYVGTSAFAHKAGLHTSAIARARDAYEHVNPELVGNGTKFVVSEMAGRSTIEFKAKELGLDIDGMAMSSVLDTLKRLEHEGYHFEVADASLELLLRGSNNWEQSFFRIESFRTITEHLTDGRYSTEATVKVWFPAPTDTDAHNEVRVVATGEGNGPVNALDAAFRSAVGDRYPQLSKVHLVDYKVRVLDSASGTGARTRVLIDSTDGTNTWTTIGVSENIIEASWKALADALVYGLLHAAS